MEITRSFQTTGGALGSVERLAILGFSFLGWLASLASVPCKFALSVDDPTSPGQDPRRGRQPAAATGGGRGRPRGNGGGGRRGEGETRQCPTPSSGIDLPQRKSRYRRWKYQPDG